jgi:hypothetical protein
MRLADPATQEDEFLRANYLPKTETDEAHYPLPTMHMMESLVRRESVDFIIYDPMVGLLSRALYVDAIVHPEKAFWGVDELIRKA